MGRIRLLFAVVLVAITVLEFNETLEVSITTTRTTATYPNSMHLESTTTMDTIICWHTRHVDQVTDWISPTNNETDRERERDRERDRETDKVDR
jgi:hypothetical protein